MTKTWLYYPEISSFVPLNKEVDLLVKGDIIMVQHDNIGGLDMQIVTSAWVDEYGQKCFTSKKYGGAV